MLNKDNIYISETSTSFVVKCFREQFNKDFSTFLKLRHEELVYGGKMVLTFFGRKDEDVYNGDFNKIFGLLTISVAKPPELSRLKCAGHHHKGNTGSNALQTE